MKRIDWVLVALCAVVFAGTCFSVKKAHAQHEEMYGHDMGHAQHHDSAYSKWQKPDGTGSCCNLKVMSVDGKTRVAGDCYPTEGRLVPDPETNERHWWALRDDGKWIPVPERVILTRTKNPDETGRSAHICESYGKVHCFREPVGVD